MTSSRIALTIGLFFVFLPVTCRAQLRLDSLYKALETATGYQKVELQFGIASRLIQIDVKKADSLIRIALKAAQENGYDELIVPAKSILASTFDKTKADSAEILLQQAIELGKETGFDKGLTGAYLNYGALLIQNQRYEEAVMQHIAGTKVAEKDSSLLVYELAHLMNLGIIMQTLEDYPSSKRYFLEALNKADRPDQVYRKAQILANLGILEFKQNNFGQAIEYHSQGYEVFKKVNARVPMSISLLNLGIAQARLDRFKEALNYFDQSLELKRQLNDERGIGLAFRYKGEVEKELNNLEEALKLLTDSEQILWKYNDQENLMQVHQQLSEVFELQGNYAKALEQNRLSESYNDSIRRKSREADINKALAKFEIDKAEREKELTIQIAGLKVQRRNQAILGLIVISLLTLFILFWNRFRLKNKLKIEHLNNQIAAQENALKVREFETEKERLEAYVEKLLASYKSLEHKKEELQTQLEVDTQKKEEVNQLIEKLRNSINNENDWTAFRLYFDRAYPNFFENLNSKIGTELTFNEERLVSLMKIRLTNKEIGIALNIQRDSVVRAKIRLKERLGFDEPRQLEDLIAKVS